MPAESVFSFLSECDFLALFHPRVLDLYTRAYTDLTGRTPPATVASSRVHGVCGHVGVYLSCLCGLWFFEKHPRAFHHVYATGTAETAIDEHAKKMSSPPCPPPWLRRDPAPLSAGPAAQPLPPAVGQPRQALGGLRHLKHLLCTWILTSRRL